MGIEMGSVTRGSQVLPKSETKSQCERIPYLSVTYVDWKVSTFFSTPLKIFCVSSSKPLTSFFVVNRVLSDWIPHIESIDNYRVSPPRSSVVFGGKGWMKLSVKRRVVGRRVMAAMGNGHSTHSTSYPQVAVDFVQLPESRTPVSHRFLAPSLIPVIRHDHLHWYWKQSLRLSF